MDSAWKLVKRLVGAGVGFIDGARRFVVNLLFVVLVVALLWSFASSRKPPLAERTALVLDLAGPIVEQGRGTAREQALERLQGAAPRQARLRDVLGALDAAARDARIERVLLVADDFAGAGLPTLREVAAAIGRVRAAGKQVIAWGSHFDQRQYYLAAHADEVWLHPMGIVALEGYGRLRNYYGEALDRLGVRANLLRVGRFKNAAEPFVAGAPSRETMEADKALYDAMWGLYTADVERARGLDAGALARGIDELPQRLAAAQGDLARLALDSHLVDALVTRDQLRQRLIERGVEDKTAKTFRQIRWGDYLARQPQPAAGPAIGVVVAEGEISDGQAPPGAVGGQSTAELIRKAREDEQIKALVLRVDSPGGSAFGAELIRRELELTRAAGKPVVVSMGDLAASGGYWIAMAADEVIADAATVTGSIGVFGMLPTAEGLMGKASVRAAGYSTTWLGHAYDPRLPLDARFAAVVQGTIERIYADFTTKAAAARKMTPQAVDAVAQGRVWTGAQAQQRGLVDRVGGWRDAVQAAATRAKLAADAPLRYIEREPGFAQRLIGMFGDEVAVRAQAAAIEALGLPDPAALPLAREMGRELAWLAEVTARRAPYAAVVHCLCEEPR